ncbi:MULTISPECIES: hypothetical protein [Sorangium]|uniref:hypothetical protein n=1 Tax=Sorangium TaxID=39643 RepID=UPI000303751F|nr:hypothetical protein [Sorangium cellulosum]
MIDVALKNNGWAAQGPPELAEGSGARSRASYAGCPNGHHARRRAFDGDHTPSPKDNGQPTTWDPREVRGYFTQL